MSKQKFNRIVRNYHDLNEEDRNKLESLANEYPYAQAIHVLLAKAHHDGKSAKAQEFLQTAAMYTSDRSILREIIASTAPTTESVDLTDDLAALKRQKAMLLQDDNKESNATAPESKAKTVTSAAEKPASGNSTSKGTPAKKAAAKRTATKTTAKKTTTTKSSTAKKTATTRTAKQTAKKPAAKTTAQKATKKPATKSTAKKPAATTSAKASAAKKSTASANSKASSTTASTAKTTATGKAKTSATKPTAAKSAVTAKSAAASAADTSKSAPAKKTTRKSASKTGTTGKTTKTSTRASRTTAPKAKTTAKSSPRKTSSARTTKKSPVSNKSKKDSDESDQGNKKKTELTSIQVPDSPLVASQQKIIKEFIRKEPSLTHRTLHIGLEQEDLSEESTRLPEDLVSENLAQIFFNQGKKEKAIEIYRKLIWKFPQKKAYFAARIEDLTK